jgi:MFS family permease
MIVSLESKRAATRPRSFAAVLSVLILAEVVSAFELSMMYVAIPTLIKDFHADTNTVAWVVTAYLLVSASCAALGGRLGDLYGRKKVMLVVLFLALVGSVVSMIGGSLAAVIIGRGIQGATGAVMALAFGLAREHLAKDKVQVGLSMIGASALIAGAFGALAAGAVIDLFSWHAIFICAAVLAVLGLLAVWFVIPRDAGEVQRQRIDVLGAVLLPVAVTCLLLGLSSAGKTGFGSLNFLGLVAIAVIAAVIWVFWELKAANPIVNIRMFKNRHIAITMIVTFVAAIGPVGGNGVLQSMLSQYPKAPITEVGQGMSPSFSGAMSCVAALVGFALSPVGGYLSKKLGARVVFFSGIILLTLPSLILVLTFGNFPIFMVATIVQAIGISLFYGALPNVLFEAVPESHSSEVTGANTMIRNIGQSTATAVMAYILATAYDPATTLTGTSGFRTGYWLLVVLGALAAVLALLLRKNPAQWNPPGASGGSLGEDRGEAAAVAAGTREASGVTGAAASGVSAPPAQAAGRHATASQAQDGDLVRD